MKRILISTKLKTTNIGNQALSDELIKLADLNTERADFMITGRPFGLDKYTFENFKSSESIDEFENLSQAIAYKARKLEKSGFKKTDLKTVKTNLLDVQGNVVKTEKYRRIVRKIRKFYFSFFLFSNAYRERLKIYNEVEYYLYSGAGEVSKSDFFLRQLLDLRVAQILGLKVCAINQSVELSTGIESKLLAHVYSKMYKIVVRGNLSKELLINNGVDSQLIYVCPDTAFRNVSNTKLKDSFNKNIALNFTPGKYDKKKYEGLIQKLLDHDYKITFISNDPMGEKELAKELKSKFNIEVYIESLDYFDYANYITKFDMLISTRLHTNELAITAGVPIVPIEGNVFKTTEVLEFVQYPIHVIKIEDTNFLSKIWENIVYVEHNFKELQNWINKNLGEISSKASRNITEFL